MNDFGIAVPFIIFTGRGREHVVIDAINNGAKFYLQKGGDPKSLFAELKNMVIQAANKNNAEKSLRESEERYRAVVESQVDMIIRFKPDGTIVFANEAYCRFFNADITSILNKRFMPVIHDEDRQKHADYITSLSIQNPVGSLEHRIILPSGDVRGTEWTYRVIYNEQGQMSEYQAVGHDVTEWRWAIGKITHLASFTEMSPFPIMEMDFDGKIHYANPAAVRFLPDRLLGSRHPFFNDLHPVIEQARTECRKTLIRRIRVDGELFEETMVFGDSLSEENGRMKIYIVNIS